MAILSNEQGDPDSLGDHALPDERSSEHVYPCGHKYCGTCKGRAEREWRDSDEGRAYFAVMCMAFARPGSLYDLSGAIGLLVGVVCGCWIGDALGWWRV